jgi:hypothetical protein
MLQPGYSLGKGSSKVSTVTAPYSSKHVFESEDISTLASNSTDPPFDTHDHQFWRTQHPNICAHNSTLTNQGAHDTAALKTDTPYRTTTHSNKCMQQKWNRIWLISIWPTIAFHARPVDGPGEIFESGLPTIICSRPLVIQRYKYVQIKFQKMSAFSEIWKPTQTQIYADWLKCNLLTVSLVRLALGKRKIACKQFDRLKNSTYTARHLASSRCSWLGVGRVVVRWRWVFGRWN